MRGDDFNLYWVPTLYFDGGYIVHVGGGSGAKLQYAQHVDNCGAQPVEDIDLDVSVQWMGKATMRITATIKNNDIRTYNGHIRVFVTEIVSTLGWKDTKGANYTHPFLDYAFDEVVSIPAFDTWEKSVVWDGMLHNNGKGQNYGGITYDNVRVVGAVYGDDFIVNYSDPPNKQPFKAYLVDEADGARPDTLSANVYTVPETGGSVNFGLYAYPENAGRNYLLLGSVSGTSPGIQLPGGMVTLPLKYDVFTGLIINLLNTALFSDFMGVLDGQGTGSATLNLPPAPGTAGTMMYFAYALNNKWDFVSNPMTVEIVP